MNGHPVAQLARTHLAGSSRIRLVPGIPPAEFHEAVARYGSGIDHAGGETPLALVKLALAGRATAQGYSGNYVVTDRRLFGQVKASNTGLQLANVPYANIAAPPAKLGALGQSVLVQAGPQPTKLYIAPRDLQAYLAAMVSTLPPAHRTFGTPPPPPRPGQETAAALAAAHVLATPDPRTWVPIRALYETHRRGLIDPALGAALVPQMTELARGLSYGRGACPPGWRTALPRSALAVALQAVLGPAAGVMPAPGGEVVDFPFSVGSGTGAAVAASVAGLAMLATAGVGWITTSHSQPLSTIRVQTADLGDGTAFQLHGVTRGTLLPLSMHWWRLVDAIHQALFRFEARYLLARALFGAGHPPDTLLTMPRDALERDTAHLIGPTDLTTFYPG